MSIKQALIIASSNTVTGQQGSYAQTGAIPGQTPGLWRRKSNQSFAYNGTWADDHPDTIVSSYNTVDFLRTDTGDTAGSFSLEFRGWFYADVGGYYRFDTLATQGALLWIGYDALASPTMLNRYGATGSAVGLITNTFYPIRIVAWSSLPGATFQTSWSRTVSQYTSAWTAWSNDFSGHIFYNSDTNGF